MEKRVITLGEVLMRLTTATNERFEQSNTYKVHFGGTEANVSISLAQWNVSATHITSFPNHSIGKTACNYLKKSGVDTNNIKFNDGRMGLYFLENGVMQRSSKIIYDRFDSSFSKLNPTIFNWDEILKDVDWFHWTGITPAISESAAQLCLDALTSAQKLGITVSGDINYRRNLWQYGKSPLEIMPELISKTNVIVGGLTDFENCLDISANNFEEGCKKVQQKYTTVHTLSNTQREILSASQNKLSAILWRNNKYNVSKTYTMENIVDRIGGGDAFMAGLIYGLMHKEEDDALEFAVASAVLKHGILGDANLVSVEEIEQLVQGDNIGRLLR
ncbi:sugar kinase [Aquimarina sp. AD1]|uniref:sugar kinase n=1 Tax=Aquimarina sp. (strain AD1) TaxID=1714848 RepID=UPI000E4B96C9|nr:sugar kinase [Aquimarina sp. AD1]AXT57658.1 sugar kinase [Aquimarina sp. AD1]RKN19390.1 sugar kinase [Aquimarina sp. AD1]